ncbi:hypothetical protein NHJ13734_006869 [Beauveria thailandica]
MSLGPVVISKSVNTISADIPGWRRHHVRDRLGEPIKSIQNFIMTLDAENQPAGFLKLAFGVAHWFLDAAHNELSLPVAAS